MTDLTVDWGGLRASEVVPGSLPDLFVGRPVVIAGRFGATDDTTVRIQGKAAGEAIQVAIRASLQGAGAAHRGIPAIWAGMKMADLADRFSYAPDPELPETIKRLALDYGLMSPFTAFIAVDSSRRTEGAEGTTVPVAVPVPDGVKYETTVGE
jgi:Ca-activated chloride channel family protein